MKASNFATVLLASAISATAMPAGNKSRRQGAVTVCSGTYSNAQCCATDVLGLAGLNCANPPKPPTGVQDFVTVCSAIGQQAKCCALPVLGQALVCQSPLGA